MLEKLNNNMESEYMKPRSKLTFSISFQLCDEAQAVCSHCVVGPE